MHVTPFALAAVLLALAAPSHAWGCQTTTSNPEVDTYEWSGVHAGPRFYVDNDPCPVECLWSIWVYQESNGIDGLQRGDEMVDNTCGGAIPHDTIIF